MVFGDAAQGPPDRAQEVMIARAEADQSPFLRELQMDSRTKARDGKFSTGQIQSIKLPDGWKEKSACPAPDKLSCLTEFNPPDNPEARLEFFYRGVRVPEAPASAFNSILAKPDHTLDRDEFQSLGEILRGKEKDELFQLDSASTETINGKRVLMLEGRYRSNDLRTMSMLIDSDGTGEAVQEVAVVSPPDRYAALKGTAREMFGSIKWK
ncbi:MAG: hypothetical protein AB7W16_11995 [Candidatus Obscuribacterales bacterium]